MKRIYTILCCVLLLVMLGVGVVSLFDKDAEFSAIENRKLKSFPKITFSGLLDGSFATELQKYYADTFPGREGLLEDNKSLNAFYYFSAFASDEDVQLVINFDSNAAQHGQSLQATENAPQETETPPEETEDVIPVQTNPTAEAEQLGNVVLVGDRAMDVPVANGERIRAYASAVTNLANILGSDVTTYSMPVPNAAAFYSHEKFRTGAYSQTAMFDLLKESLGENVTFIDAYNVLAKHTDEYLYFRTDHHWTHLGAYYAYTALCKAAGMEAAPQSKFDTGKWENFVGSMYTYIANYPQSSVLKNNPDTVHYWKPYANCETYYYSDTSLSDGVLMGTICRIPEDEQNKYLTFMGGDHPVTIVTTDTQGPCILVIKESYGNALISWLTSNYSKIILIDPREYFAKRDDIDLADFAKSQGVDQCLVVNYPMMLNSEGYITLLEKLAK